ncbi:MAG: hypothetical protein ACRC0I_07200 [Sediminibacterium sp.]|nr:hypothetical protein [Chitinophagaceae bacterium]MCA6445837.1 hypothetical protein [Chitinophagaceae bacterium]
MIEYNLDIATVDQLSKQELIDTINYLIINDFERLIYALYRIDVSERKIRDLLENRSDINAANLIADAIITRQSEKKIAKEKYKQAPPDTPEDRW